MHIHHNDLYGHALAQEPLPQNHEIWHFGRPFLGHHNYILRLSVLCLGVESREYFTPKLPPLGVGSMKELGP